MVKRTSYLNLQTLITYTPVIILAPWCVWCSCNILSTILFQVLSHLTYFSHIVTLNSYFPTMSQSTGTLRLAKCNIQHILFTNCVLYNISNCTQWLTIVYYHLEFNSYYYLWSVVFLITYSFILPLYLVSYILTISYRPLSVILTTPTESKSFIPLLLFHHLLIFLTVVFGAVQVLLPY